MYFDGEVDRVFCGLDSSRQIIGGGFVGRRQTFVEADGLPTVIAWSPGQAALSMADIGEHYREFVCIERGVAFADEVVLPAGERWGAGISITLGTEG